MLKNGIRRLPEKARFPMGSTFGSDILDPRTSALVVVDVQNDFCHPDGAAAKMGLDISAVQEAVPRILELIASARDADVPRIYLRGEHSRWFNTDVWLRRGAKGHSIDAPKTPIVEAGSWGAEFFEVDPQPDELVVTKHRYSGFAYTPLELALQTLHTTNVVICGTATNVCVEATARDAIMRGYYPVVIADCVASGQADLHGAALKDMAEYLGAVASLADVQEAWQMARRDGSVHAGGRA
jgi:ureidoacrylate peracid hydrolase